MGIVNGNAALIAVVNRVVIGIIVEVIYFISQLGICEYGGAKNRLRESE